MHRVNYDQIAHLYDEPARDHAADPSLLAFLKARDGLDAPRVLDIGCGTGKQLMANKAAFPQARFAGVDRFLGMLRIAQTRAAGISWTQADGRALPFRSGAFDYITCQFAYPHFGGVSNLLAEVFRVLRPRGRFVMTNIDPWAMRDWILYRCFPAAYELDTRDFVPVEALAASLRAAGLDPVKTSRTDATCVEDIRAFFTFASNRYRASQLMAISDVDYQRGLKDIEAHINAPNRVHTVDSQFVVVTVTGDKP